MHYLFRLALFLLFCPLKLLAWQYEPLSKLQLSDTLSASLNKYSSGKEKLKYLFKVIEKQQYSHPWPSYRAAHEAVFLANSHGLPLEGARAYLWRSWLFYQNGTEPYDHALADVSQSIKISEQLNAAYETAWGHGLRAALRYHMSKDGAGATEDLNAGLKAIANLSGRPRDSLWLVAYLNSVNANVQKNDMALQQRSLDLFTQVGDSVRVGRTCVKLGLPYLKKGQFALAQHYFQRAIKAYSKTSFEEGKNEALYRYTDLLLYQYEKTQSDSFFRHIATINRLDDTLVRQDAERLGRLGIAYALKASFIKQAAINRRYNDTAFILLQQAWPLAISKGRTTAIKVIADNLKRYYQLSGGKDTLGFKIVADYQKLLAQKNREAVTAQSLLLEFNEKDRHETLEAARAREKQTVTKVFLSLLAIVIGLLFYMQQRNIRHMNRELQSRIEALRAQMNPHFISNTLNAIDSLVNQHRNKEASNYIIEFSRLCRMILNNTRSEIITLDEELEMLRYFLSLEQLRLGEKLRYSIEVEPSLSPHNLMIPPLILQPFVENAIWHGIQPKEGAGTVLIKVAQESDTMYTCSIQDDGIGREKSQELKKQMVLSQPSHGLTITEERIETLQKMKGSRIVVDDLHHENQPTGTLITITLPIKTTQLK